MVEETEQPTMGGSSQCERNSKSITTIVSNNFRNIIETQFLSEYSSDSDLTFYFSELSSATKSSKSPYSKDSEWKKIHICYHYKKIFHHLGRSLSLPSIIFGWGEIVSSVRCDRENSQWEIQSYHNTSVSQKKTISFNQNDTWKLYGKKEDPVKTLNH